MSVFVFVLALIIGLAVWPEVLEKRDKLFWRGGTGRSNA
jgi:hypothetical protein